MFTKRTLAVIFMPTKKTFPISLMRETIESLEKSTLCDIALITTEKGPRKRRVIRELLGWQKNEHIFSSDGIYRHSPKNHIMVYVADPVLPISSAIDEFRKHIAYDYILFVSPDTFIDTPFLRALRLSEKLHTWDYIITSSEDIFYLKCTDIKVTTFLRDIMVRDIEKDNEDIFMIFRPKDYKIEKTRVILYNTQVSSPSLCVPCSEPHKFIPSFIEQHNKTDQSRYYMDMIHSLHVGL